MKQILEKDERIHTLEAQFKQLESRISQLEFSPPREGGPEFKKILLEATLAGDFK